MTPAPQRHGDAWKAGLQSCEARGEQGIVTWVPCTDRRGDLVVFFGSATMTGHDGTQTSSAVHGILSAYVTRQRAAANGFTPTPTTR